LSLGYFVTSIKFLPPLRTPRLVSQKFRTKTLHSLASTVRSGRSPDKLTGIDSVLHIKHNLALCQSLVDVFADALVAFGWTGSSY
jgi:hypothetical protein